MTRAGQGSVQARDEVRRRQRATDALAGGQHFSPALAEALFCERGEAQLSGDLDTGKTLLRDYIKATVGFEPLGEATGAPPKSLIRMFGPRGNPQARNLFGVIDYLQQRGGGAPIMWPQRLRRRRRRRHSLPTARTNQEVAQPGAFVP